MVEVISSQAVTALEVAAIMMVLSAPKEDWGKMIGQVVSRYEFLDLTVSRAFADHQIELLTQQLRERIAAKLESQRMAEVVFHSHRDQA